jgi:hypothetical protein
LASILRKGRPTARAKIQPPHILSFFLSFYLSFFFKVYCAVSEEVTEETPFRKRQLGRPIRWKDRNATDRKKNAFKESEVTTFCPSLPDRQTDRMQHVPLQIWSLLPRLIPSYHLETGM